MKSFLKQIKLVSLIDALVCIVVGLLMVFCTDFTRETLIYLFAGLFFVIGLVKIINYFVYGFEPFGFILGLVDFCIGIVFISNVQSILNSNIIGIIFGVILLIKSLFAIQESLDLRRMGAKLWWLDTILSTIIFAFAISVICNPNADRIMFELVGITLMIDGIFNLVDIFIVSAKVKKTKKSLKDIFKIEDDNVIDI